MVTRSRIPARSMIAATRMVVDPRSPRATPFSFFECTPRPLDPHPVSCRMTAVAARSIASGNSHATSGTPTGA